ncbi:MAG TPA: CaiB/BaiF CoA-transferase family protein [Candidatus Binataceae bacterium]|jgi:crotonobetainyl-CoA:carnitine CoA-transferase CaiB-like acyl-CoA transferase|nr:CaiB/BaiF CoA-transferase family protein [Candidatus Binataceae bacterium]
MAGPLEHIRVLELSRVLAGPWAAQTVADLGASVIKVEKPVVGDDTRTYAPPYAATSDGGQSSESAYFLSTNRGKRSVTIDFIHPEGQRLVQALAAKSDVVIENFKVGGLAKYGLDYPSLKPLNPGLVYCSITGFGQTGPYRHKPGYDFMIQGIGGLMSITGEPDQRPGGGPMKVGVAVADVFTGLYATIAILGALSHRDRTGAGQHIDLALLDTQVAVLANQAMNYLVTGVAPQRLGNAHPNIVPYQVFAASDGHIIVAVGNENQYARLCEVIGRPDLASDEHFATNAARVNNRDELIAALGGIFLMRTMRQWLDALERAGVPCGPINTIADVFADPQVQARGMRLDLPHPALGSVPSVANPIKYSATPLSYRSAPPMLGANTDEILRDILGIAPAEIARMRKAGIV